MLEVRLSLEERHNVEHRRFAAGRELGQLEDLRDVRRRAGEADDEPAAGVHAVSVLDAFDGAKRLQHLVVRGQSRAVLPDLEAREVEPEGLHLPHQAAELTVREAPVSRGDERVGDYGEVIHEVVRLGVAPGAALTSGANSIRQVQQVLAMRLRRRSFCDLGETNRIGRGGHGEALAQGPAGRGRGLVDRQRSADAGGRVLQGQQHVLGLDGHRLLGDLRGH